MTIDTAASATAATTSRKSSAKQKKASKSNGACSKGPTSPEGKKISSQNARKHGLTAKTIILPGEDPEILQMRILAWKDDLLPQNDLEDFLIERMACCSWQAERADRTLAACLTKRINAEHLDRALREADEVADLSRCLFWDPRGPISVYPYHQAFHSPPRISWPDTVEDPLNPAKIVNRLEALAGGCRWLLDRWTELRGLLESGLKWQAPDRFKAIRMLGHQPMDALDDHRLQTIYLACHAMDPDGPPMLYDLTTELTNDEMKRFTERFEGRIVPGRRPADPSAARVLLLELVEFEVTRLQARLSMHQNLEVLQQSIRLQELAFDESHEGELLRRYHLGHSRQLDRSVQTYLKVCKETAARGGAEASDAELASDEVGDSSEPKAEASVTPLVDVTDPVGWADQPDDAPERPVGDPAPIVTDMTDVLAASVARSEASASLVADCIVPTEPTIDPADETNPTPADRLADETNPTPVDRLADETNPTTDGQLGVETNPTTDGQLGVETNPTADACLADETNPTTDGQLGVETNPTEAVAPASESPDSSPEITADAGPAIPTAGEPPPPARPAGAQLPTEPMDPTRAIEALEMIARRFREEGIGAVLFPDLRLAGDGPLDLVPPPRPREKRPPPLPPRRSSQRSGRAGPSGRHK